MRYALAILTCLFFAGSAFADETADAITEVFVVVNPNIGVQGLSPWVDMGTVQTGTFQGYIPWQVDANTQNVMFWAAASNLFKGDDPTSPVVPPIPVELTSGINIHIQDGGPVGGQDENLSFVGAFDIGDFPGFITEAVEYESSTPGHLSQQVDMYVWWTQSDPEKPMGEYSGLVELFGMVVLF